MTKFDTGKKTTAENLHERLIILVMVKKYFCCLSLACIVTTFCFDTANSQQTYTWTSFGSGLPVTAGINNFAWISNRFGPGTYIFAGTGGKGVYRSIDEGKRWDAVNTGLNNLDVRSFIISGITIYAGTQNGIYKTIDQGNTWSLTGSAANGLANTSVTSFALGVNFTLYAGTLGGGIYRSKDNGLQWESINVGLRNRVITALTVITDTVVLAGTPEGIFRSINGDLWTPSNVGLPELYSITGFAGFGTLAYASTFGGGVYRTRDFGATWQPVNTNIKNLRITSVALINLPNSSIKPLLASTYGGGVYASFDEGESWTDASYGIPTPLITRVSVVETSPIVAVLGGGGYFSTAVNSPPPQIISVTPASATAGTQQLTMTIEGVNFSAPSVSLDGIPLEVISHSATSITIQTSLKQFVYEGARPLEVKNADGQKARTPYFISGPTAPSVATLSPPAVRVQTTPFTLAIGGSNFHDNATATVNGVPVTILGRLATLLLVDVPIEALLEPGNVPVRVTNPKTNEYSEGQLTIRARPPQIFELSPPAVSAGAPAFQLTINGTDFFTTATVSISGTNLNIIQQSTTQIVATVPASLITAIGIITITVSNPDGQSVSAPMKVVEFGVTLSVDKPLVCPGTPVQISGTIIGGVGNFRIVSWTPPVISSQLVGRVITATAAPTTPTTYTVKLADESNVETFATASIGVLQPVATSIPQNILFDTVNTFFTRINQKTFVVRNTSPDKTSITLNAPRTNTNNFSVITQVAGTILAGDQSSTIFTIQFTPQRDGLVQDTLFIPYEPCGKVLAIPLSGVRITPSLATPVPIPLQPGPSGSYPPNQPPNFLWLPVEFAASYALQIARADRQFSVENGFNSTEYPINTTATTTITPTFTLQANTIYAWTIRSVNSATTSNWSSPLYFITAPSGPQRLSLSPTTINFGGTFINETERRGIQITNTDGSAQTITGVDFFPPQTSTQPIFSLSDQLTRTSPTQFLPSNGVLLFRPTDTISYVSILRVRTATDTLLGYVTGRGITCGGSMECAETVLGLKFKPFKDNQLQPEIGDTVTLQLYMVNSLRLDQALYAGKAQRMSAEIIIHNPDVLYPFAITNPSNLSAQQFSIGRARIRFNDVPVNRGQASNNVILAEIQALALLADTLSTKIQMAEFVWTDASPPDAPIRRILRDSSITLETCLTGGSPRLLAPKSTVLSIVQSAPNPATDAVKLTFVVHTETLVTITLVDVLGRTIKSVPAGTLTPETYSISIPTGDLITGTYLIVLQTPLENITHRIGVVK